MIDLTADGQRDAIFDTLELFFQSKQHAFGYFIHLWEQKNKLWFCVEKFQIKWNEVVLLTGDILRFVVNAFEALFSVGYGAGLRSIKLGADTSDFGYLLLRNDPFMQWIVE